MCPVCSPECLFGILFIFRNLFNLQTQQLLSTSPLHNAVESFFSVSTGNRNEESSYEGSDSSVDPTPRLDLPEVIADGHIASHTGKNTASEGDVTYCEACPNPDLATVCGTSTHGMYSLYLHPNTTCLQKCPLLLSAKLVFLE